MGDVEYGKPMQDPGDYLSAEKIKELLGYVKNVEKHDRDYLLLKTLAVSARRRGEVVGVKNKNGVLVSGLTPANIDYDLGVVHWGILKKEGKTKKGVTYRVPIPEPLPYIMELKSYAGLMNIGMGERFFSMTGRNVEYIVKKYAKALGLRTHSGKVPTPHTLRHSWVMNAIRLGIPDRVINAKLQHADARTTQAYGGVMNAQLRVSGQSVYDLMT